MTAIPRQPVVAVVGGGVAGIAAALEARALCPSARIVLLEASGALGGKVRVSDVGGVAVDEGADALLRRVPEGLGLAADAGLSDELVSPATGAAGVVVGGRVQPLPTGTFMGVPTGLRGLVASGVLSPAGLARAALGAALPAGALTDDVAVGALVGRRLGREVVDRLVDPLLGGVYAGRADGLSLQATLPALAAALDGRRSLLGAAAAARSPRAPGGQGPVFASLPGGLGRLSAPAAAASGAEVRLRTTVRGLVRGPSGWRLELGPASAPEAFEADAVVLAVPAGVAARLLGDAVPSAAGELAGIDYASVAIVTLVLAGPTPGVGSGYLVPAGPGRVTKAVTFSSRKWAHVGGPDVAVVRVSVGRHGETADLQRDDADLVGVVARELAGDVGPLGPLVDSRVTRWGGALPQYAVGHLDRVGRAVRAVEGEVGLGVAGAFVMGIGVPACVRSGQHAARAALRAVTMGA